jgi:dihydrofolate reductase
MSQLAVSHPVRWLSRFSLGGAGRVCTWRPGDETHVHAGKPLTRIGVSSYRPADEFVGPESSKWIAQCSPTTSREVDREKDPRHPVHLARRRRRDRPGRVAFPLLQRGAAVDQVLGEADTLLLGRETYDSFAEAWPEREAAGGEDAEFAKHLGDARKIVVSKQQLEFTWRNSEQLKGDLVEAVTALKNESRAGHIAISGSPSIVRQLLAAGLLDELHLLVHPVAVRKGMRLFDEGESWIPLTLISSNTFKTGVLNLVYGPAESTGNATYDDAKVHLSQP